MQTAVDASSPGDLILVDQGSYPAFRISGKSLSVVASDVWFTIVPVTGTPAVELTGTSAVMPCT